MRVFDITAKIGADTTRVAVSLDLLDRVGNLLAEAMACVPPGRAVLVSDETVGALYADRVAASLRTAGFQVLEHRIPPGEASKRLAVAERVYDTLAAEHVGRDGVVCALGGGVVSDLAGFVAATWMRGIPFAICPTTVEAVVDASLGGKTAVNVGGGKNLVGAFHQPVLVAVDPGCLRTLDRRDVCAGLAESVKHALITDEAFLSWHEANVDSILALEPGPTTELILRNLRIKAEIVTEDAKERTDRRMLLNFGHTIGHAIEACAGFSLRHGECVALGMLAACRLSASIGSLEVAVVERVRAILGRFDLPTQLAEAMATDDIIAFIRNDKKVTGGAPRLVLLDDVGRPVIRDDVTERQIRAAFESLRG